MTPADGQVGMELLELAKLQTRQSRQQLFENMTDLFLSPDGRLTERDRAVMTDIISKLIGEVETELKRSLAERLAVIPEAPRELVVQLANDAAEVARPVVMASRVLRDVDLIEVVKHRSQEHRLAVAMRAGVGVAVTDTLIEYGDQNVIEALIRNQDAALSRQAIDYLVEESRRIDRFQEPLLRRSDLPVPLAYRMFWWVSAALRRHILATFEVAEVDLDDVIETAVHASMAQATGPDYEAEKLAARMFERGELKERSLLQALRNGYVNAFVAGLGRLAGIDLATTRRIFFSSGGEALATVCKAAGWDRGSFSTVYLLAREMHQPGVPLPPAALDNLLDTYDKLDQARARSVLRYWMRDRAYLDATAAFEPDGTMERV